MHTSISKLITVQMTEDEARALVESILSSTADEEPLNALYNVLKAELGDNETQEARPLSRKSAHKQTTSASAVVCDICGEKFAARSIKIHKAKRHKLVIGAA